MRNLPIKKFFVMLLAIMLLPLATVLAQTQLAQWGPSPEQQERERQKQEQQEHRREEQNEQWQKHHQRYFGGPAIQPGPRESREEYRRRVMRRCQEHWPVCAAPCNTLPDPYWRNACVANCNNELHECQTRY